MTDTPDMKSVEELREAASDAEVALRSLIARHGYEDDHTTPKDWSEWTFARDALTALSALLSSYRVMGDGGSSVAERGYDASGASDGLRKSEDDPALTEAMAAVDRWLDREHHRFPSSPVSSSVATIYYALEARLKKEGFR